MLDSIVIHVFVVCFLLMAIAFDATKKKIPNWLVFSAGLGGVFINTLRGQAYLLDSALGLGVAIALLLLPFILGWIGAGDLKLMCAIGLILGVPIMPRIFVYASLVGGLMAMISILFNWQASLKLFKQHWLGLKLFFMTGGSGVPPIRKDRIHNHIHTIPYGIALSIGTLVSIFLDSRGNWIGF